MKHLPAFVMLLITILAATVSNILPLHAQSGVVIEGKTSGGAFVPALVGADGTLYANISGVLTMGGTTWSQTAVTVTSGVTAIVAADSTLKYIQIYNGSATGNIFIGPFSPVSSTTGYKVGPGQANAPLSPPINGLWAIGDIASNASIIVTTGR